MPSKEENDQPDTNRRTTQTTGPLECIIFTGALVAGTACSICSKTMMQMHGTDIYGNENAMFTKPIFQTFGMFVGMTFGLVLHGMVVVWKLPFPGYIHAVTTPQPTTTTIAAATYGSIPQQQQQQQEASSSIPPTTTSTPLWMYFFLAIPSLFDLAATALCMMGLQYLPVSMYQLLRGSGIIFVALLKQGWLKDTLYRFQWYGVACNVLAVVLVGCTAVLAASNSNNNNGGGEDAADGAAVTTTPHQALWGILLVLLGAWVQALQYVVEEKVMSLSGDDAAASVPTLLLIGMEGLWGTLACICIVYPLTSYVVPGQDYNGAYEHWYSTYVMLCQTRSLQWAVLIYSGAIFAYNLLAVLVTFLLNSIWHAILDNFRPLTIWAVGLALYYGDGKGDGYAGGEPWMQPESWIQVAGLVVLLYGTAVYNAPNPGAIELRGQWYALGVDCTDEYEELEEEAKWEARKLGTRHGSRRASSLAELSPYIIQQAQWRKLEGSFIAPKTTVAEPTLLHRHSGV